MPYIQIMIQTAGNSLAATVTFPTAGTYYICAELKDASSDVVDPVYVTVTVTDSSSEEKGYSLSLNKTEATVALGQSVDLSATVKSDGQTERLVRIGITSLVVDGFMEFSLNRKLGCRIFKL